MIIIVMLMLNVRTLLGASPVPVTKDTVEIGLTLLVSYILFMYVLHITQCICVMIIMPQV